MQCLPTIWRHNAINLAMPSLSPYTSHVWWLLLELIFNFNNKFKVKFYFKFYMCTLCIVLWRWWWWWRYWRLSLWQHCRILLSVRRSRSTGKVCLKRHYKPRGVASKFRMTQRVSCVRHLQRSIRMSCRWQHCTLSLQQLRCGLQ